MNKYIEVLLDYFLEDHDHFPSKHEPPIAGRERWYFNLIVVTPPLYNVK